MSKFLNSAVALLALSCAGCATHKFNDRPHGPAVVDIQQRVRCELLELVREGSAPELVIGNYGFAGQLSLTVNKVGSVTPSFRGTFPITGGDFLVLGGFGLSNAREDNMFVYIEYSMRELKDALKGGTDPLKLCHANDTRWAGDLGIRDKVLAAIGVANRQETDVSKGEFGGTINFTVLGRLDAFGPSWSLEQFSGPGGLLGAAATHTNKITFVFARGSEKKGVSVAGTARAREVLRDALLDDSFRR